MNIILRIMVVSILLCRPDKMIGMLSLHEHANDEPVNREKTLRILNETPHKIGLCLQMLNEPPFVITLIQDQAFTLFSPEFLIVFKAEAYGKYREWFTLKSITGGFVGVKDWCLEIAEAFTPVTHFQVQVSVVMGAEIVQIPLVRRILGEIAPYGITWRLFNPEEVRDFRRGQGRFVDLFPQVHAARVAEREIKPHYVLSIPENAQQNDIQQAYRFFSTYLDYLATKGDTHKKVVNAMRALLRAAFDALNQGLMAQFYKEIAKQEVCLLDEIELSV